MKNKIAILLVLLFATYSFNAKAQPGANDPTFNPTDLGFGLGDGANNTILTTPIQSDGKIVIGGFFTTYNGTVINRIARLNADGTLDDTFNPGIGANDAVYTCSIQGDGKIIIGGLFTSYNGTAINRIARLNADGSLDNTFNPGTGANYGVTTCAIQGDGKIIIGGSFTIFNGIDRGHVVRLNADGSPDDTFNSGTGANYTVESIDIQSDEKIIIGGGFTSYNEISTNYIARLNTDGSFDDTFNSGTGANWNVIITIIQSDGKIIINGNFTLYNNTIINRIARLNTDGTLDGTFNPGTGANKNVNVAIIQNDGKIIIVGWFSSYNGIARNGIARLNADGSLDETFNPGAGANNYVYTASLQDDGKIIIGGDFHSYNGIARNHIARINTDGSLDETFNPGTGASSSLTSSSIQSDGKIIIGGRFFFYNGIARNHIARLNADGSLDDTFNPGTGANNTVYKTTIQGDGNIIIGGAFESYNGTLINHIVRLNPNGSLDDTFNPGAGANGYVFRITVQSDGKIVIGGDFTSFNETPINYFTRLNTDGSIDDTFNVGIGANNTVNGISIQNNGNIIISGNFTSYNGIGRNRVARIEGGDLSSVAPTFEERIAVYPNPVVSELNIEIPGNNEKTSFEILNSIGQVVFKGNLVEKATVPTSNFIPGVYLVKIGNGKTYEFKKIIKQ